MTAGDSKSYLSFISQPQFEAGYHKSRVTPDSITDNFYRLRLMLPRQVQSMSNYAVESLVSIEAVIPQKSDYYAVKYELADAESIEAVKHPNYEPRTMLIRFDGLGFIRRLVGRGLFKRSYEQRQFVSYLMQATDGLRDVIPELSKDRPINKN